LVFFSAAPLVHPRKGAEKVAVQSRSPEKNDAKYDALLERLKALEQSVSSLGSEVKIGTHTIFWNDAVK